MKSPNDFLNELTAQLTDLLDQSKHTGNDVRDNIRALIQSQLTKLDVVSREEFEVQQAALENNRKQLRALEAQLSALEAELEQRRQSSASDQ